MLHCSWSVVYVHLPLWTKLCKLARWRSPISRIGSSGILLTTRLYLLMRTRSIMCLWLWRKLCSLKYVKSKIVVTIFIIQVLVGTCVVLSCLESKFVNLGFPNTVWVFLLTLTIFFRENLITTVHSNFLTIPIHTLNICIWNNHEADWQICENQICTKSDINDSTVFWIQVPTEGLTGTLHLVCVSDDALTDILDLDPSVAESEVFIDFVAGKYLPSGGLTVSHRYLTFYFGSYYIFCAENLRET